MAERGRDKGDQYKPRYLVIADDLRDGIKSGERPPGDRIPGERELCEQWKCSSITARHALTTLRDEGLVTTVRGKGAFVAKYRDRPLVRVAPDRFRRAVHRDRPTYRQEAERAALDLRVEHETELVDAPAEVAEQLAINEGDPVTETSYRINMGDEPVSMSLAWESLAITRGTDIELPHEGPYAGHGIVPRFDSIGYQVDMEEERVTARFPEAHEIVQLDAPAGQPLIQIWQTFWAGDVPVETAKILYRADRYEFHYRLPID